MFSFCSHGMTINKLHRREPCDSTADQGDPGKHCSIQVQRHKLPELPRDLWPGLPDVPTACGVPQRRRLRPAERGASVVVRGACFLTEVTALRFAALLGSYCSYFGVRSSLLAVHQQNARNTATSLTLMMLGGSRLGSVQKSPS